MPNMPTAVATCLRTLLSSWRRCRGPLLGLALGISPVGCGRSETAPEHPTWVDVEPILRGRCTHCHGASSVATGAGYRFDFYDMSAEVCGAAAEALGAMTPLGKAQAPQIAHAITTPRAELRPSMPPLPAPYLDEWEWRTILTWVSDPRRGVRPDDNAPPRVRLEGAAATADETFSLVAIAEDPDGDPVVGLLKVGEQVHKMDRSGAFAARIDTGGWPAGETPITAVVCDGWSNASYALGSVKIAHGR